jgi:23S rRNA (guanosine2251-2'-O)-methyltransferase
MEVERAARSAGLRIRAVPREELERVAGAAHNGVAAQVAERDYDALEDALAGEKGARLVLFLDEVTDPGNLGSILRSAAAAGASVILPERHASGLTETVAKASAGALERVKVARIGNAAQFLRAAKDEGFWIYGADAEGETVWSADMRGDVLLCLGAEGTGLRRLTKETCDQLVAIPMAPGSGSLNVSVAAGILLFEVVRKRSEGEKAPKGETPARK